MKTRRSTYGFVLSTRWEVRTKPKRKSLTQNFIPTNLSQRYFQQAT